MAIVHNQFLSRPYGDGWFQPIPSLESGRKVPSLRGRMVLPRPPNNRSATRPVPTGTDCSSSYILIANSRRSRPYGDGWFHGSHLRRPDRQGPVPTGTDGSTDAVEPRSGDGSRPYGDGWFLKIRGIARNRLVPSLRGRMVLISLEKQAKEISPVPTGTDGS